MPLDNIYLFKSARLGFRNWSDIDVEKMSEINADTEVMEFFPGIQTKIQTIIFIERMKKQLTENSFCYFAVDKLENNQFIGFIGLAEQTFDSDFTPCIDIGWR
jgi:RimJ/RimL family protein N-acetyltransferase